MHGPCSYHVSSSSTSSSSSSSSSTTTTTTTTTTNNNNNNERILKFSVHEENNYMYINHKTDTTQINKFNNARSILMED